MSLVIFDGTNDADKCLFTHDPRAKGYLEKSVPGKQHSNLHDLGKFWESSFYTGSRSSVLTGLDAGFYPRQWCHKKSSVSRECVIFALDSIDE